jgi:hypothetical protein
MKILKHTLKTIALLAIVFGCSNNSESNQEEERLALDNLKNEIEQLIATGTCSENSACDFIAFGSKPCGGAWSYLVYNNSINVELLKEKVSIFNKKEADYNKKWSIFSDCMMVIPPTNVECINGKCTAVYK